MSERQPLPFLSAFAAGSDARELVNICVRQFGSISSKYNVGFIYASDALNDQLNNIIKQLIDTTGVQQWSGTLSSAICSDGKELYDHPGIAILLCEFGNQNFQFFHRNSANTVLHAPHKSFKPCFGIVHGDPTDPETPSSIELCLQFGTDLHLSGGLTLSQTQQTQVLDRQLVSGVSGVVFSAGQAIVSDSTQGCSPLGKPHMITQGEKNFILKLDGKPALDVLRDEVGEVLARDLTRLGGYVFAGLIRIGSDHSDYLVRDLIAIDEAKGALVIGDDIVVGDELVFCRRDGNSASDDLDRMLQRVIEQLEGRTARGALYFSCINRGRRLFGENSQELQRIQSTLGSVPLAGFFASAEVFRGKLYSQAGVLTLFL